MTTISYDLADRPFKERWFVDAASSANPANALNTIASAYFTTGELKSISDNFATYAYAYDYAGRMLSENNAGTPNMPSVTVSYQYYADGARLRLTDQIGASPAQAFSYARDELGRLTGINDATANGPAGWGLVGFQYGPDNQLTRLSRQNAGTGIAQPITTLAYEPATGRLASITHKLGVANPGTTAPWSQFVDQFLYQYDRDDRLTRSSSLLDGAASYSFDKIDQLLSADRAGTAGDEAYAVDHNGNRLSVTRPNDGARTYDYTSAANPTLAYNQNRLLDDGVYTYAYTKEGALKSRTLKSDTTKTTDYTWDHHNRLARVAEKNGAVVTKQTDFTYDPLGRRIKKVLDPDGATGSAATVTAKYAYDGDELYLQFDGASALQHRYLHGEAVDMILVDEDFTSGGSMALRWPLLDHENSVRDLVTGTGVVQNHKAYDSFGNVMTERDTSAAKDVIFGYTGRPLDDETGLQNNRARYYDPRIGRFISTDPAGLAGGDANLYRYAGNSPLTHAAQFDDD